MERNSGFTLDGVDALLRHLGPNLFAYFSFLVFHFFVLMLGDLNDVVT